MTDPADRTLLSMDEWLATLRVEGERLAEVAEAAAFDAPVPGCPGWDVEALVRHMGDVHRWAATIVRDRVQQRLRIDFTGPPHHDELLEWYRQGLAQLLETLSATSPHDVFWMWGAAPSAVAFWARRQAHETAVHRLDAEQAARVPETAFREPAAVDGIDEWLMLAPRRVKVTDGRVRSLQVTPTDAPDRWLVQLHDDGLAVTHGEGTADCTVRAPASELFKLLMNRRGPNGLDVDGDADMLRWWREHVRFE